VQRHRRLVGEAAIPFGGGDVALPTDSIFTQPNRLAREVKDIRYESSPISRFNFLALTAEADAV
jgi:hypothetical protein